MSKSYRNNPRRATCSESTFTRFEFDRMFPDDAACLDWLFKRRFPDGVHCPNCKKVTPHYREKSRPSYSCHCGHHVHPMRGTIFQDSATSLRLWFLAIYLMATTRCGISAKQVERELGVTYKCAWRICKQIRSMMDEDAMNLLGEIEIDETRVGGKAKNKHRWDPEPKKAIVFGMIERKGRVIAAVVPNARGESVLPHVKKRILPKSLIYSDEATAYDPLLEMGYGHKRVNHSQHIYVRGNANTNTIESFWSLAKRGIDGVRHSVSKKHLQTYFNEYAYRWNHRDDSQPMFFQMLDRAPASVKSGG